MKSFNYVINDELGIHARPAGLLAKEVKNFASEITLVKGDKRVSAKGVMGIMTLNVKKGDTVTVEANGSDEDSAISSLESFFKGNL
ncbi:MAG: HPr family phosphocarrier protein [Lachnospiraceae bacterium]|jgi:phosphocarrier protein|nr:HPr family phosphocarrier protein [Lachnospiraceae bacterium]MBR5357452.1 HPr family phosphocarrier protein [Lachnospiraceae bacterium]MCR4934666.1 HPr family phosphocarrier protein [Lachnospiraceae bacterium]